MIDKEVRKMISNKIDIDDIYAYVKTSQDLKTLRDQAIDYVKQGITTMDELYKITSYLD